MLGTVYDQHVVPGGLKMRPREVRGDNLPLGLPAGMGLIAQVRFDIAPGGDLPERLPQQLPLARQGGIVEV